jgi:hypothetical protein
VDKKILMARRNHLIATIKDNTPQEIIKEKMEIATIIIKTSSETKAIDLTLKEN